MHLTPKEARIIQELRALPTCKVEVVQVSGEIKGITTTVSAEIADKASGKGDLWAGVPRETPPERRRIQLPGQDGKIGGA